MVQHSQHRQSPLQGLLGSFCQTNYETSFPLTHFRDFEILPLLGFVLPNQLQKRCGLLGSFCQISWVRSAKSVRKALRPVGFVLPNQSASPPFSVLISPF